MKKLLLLLCSFLFLGGSNSWADEMPTPVYSQDFESASTTVGEAGSNFGITGATLSGTGSIETGDVAFGRYYQNMTTTAAATTRKINYLTIATTAFSEAKTAGNNAVTISFWINPFYALDLSQDNRHYGNIFVAYGNGNTVNTDMAIGLNARANLGTHCNMNYSPYQYYYDEGNGGNYSWLSKGASFAKSWHHVALVFSLDESSNVIIKQYIDGALLKSYTKANAGSGDQATYNEMTLLDQFTKFVIGGDDQIFGDPDNAYAYDEIAIYDEALTSEQILQIISNKLQAEIVGALDYSTPYWSVWNKTPIWINVGETGYYKFVNHNKGGKTYENWYLYAANESSENLTVLRADNYVNIGGGTINSFPETSDITADLADATVELYVSLADAGDGTNTLRSTAIITKADHSVMSPNYVYTQTGLTASKLKLYISPEKNWLELLSQAVETTIGANGYTTFASPNALDLTKANLPSGLKAYKAQSVNSTYVHFEEFDQTVPANTGILFEGTASATYNIPVVASGDDVSENAFEVNATGAKFSPAANTKYYALIKNSIPMAFGWFEPNSVAIPANKAYIPVVNGTNARLVISFDEEDPTGINTVETAELEVDGLKDGKYIIDNKVVIVKNGVKYSANGQILK